MKKTDLSIAGGLAGLETAMQRLRTCPVSPLTVLEKQIQLAVQQFTKNSGDFHAGLAYRPGTVKAAIAVQGIRLLAEFYGQHGIPYEICGKIVIATDQTEIPRLRQLEEQGRDHGLTDLAWLRAPDTICELKPHAACLEARHVPAEGIVAYVGMARAMALVTEQAGGRMITAAKVTALLRDGREWRATTSAGDFTGEFVVAYGGLQLDRLVRSSERRTGASIVPFRDKYYQFRQDRTYPMRDRIYALLAPTFPFLEHHSPTLSVVGVEAGTITKLTYHRDVYRRGSYRFMMHLTRLHIRDLGIFDSPWTMAAYQWYRS